MTPKSKDRVKAKNWDKLSKIKSEENCVAFSVPALKLMSISHLIKKHKHFCLHSCFPCCSVFIETLWISCKFDHVSHSVNAGVRRSCATVWSQKLHKVGRMYFLI